MDGVTKGEIWLGKGSQRLLAGYRRAKAPLVAVMGKDDLGEGVGVSGEVREFPGERLGELHFHQVRAGLGEFHPRRRPGFFVFDLVDLLLLLLLLAGGTLGAVV